MPGYHAGRPPRNKGIRYPADPPTVDEIVAVMHHTGDDRHAWRLEAMIVMLWRAGLRIAGGAGARRTRPRPAARVGAGSQRQGRAPTRGRDGRVVLPAGAPVAGRADRAARGTAVPHHRRPDRGRPWSGPRSAPARPASICKGSIPRRSSLRCVHAADDVRQRRAAALSARITKKAAEELSVHERPGGRLRRALGKRAAAAGAEATARLQDFT